MFYFLNFTLMKYLILIFWLFAVLLPSASASSHDLRDIEGDFKTYIQRAYQAWIISGYGDGTFRPNNTVSFVESLKILINSGPKRSKAIEQSSDKGWQDKFKRLYQAEDYTNKRVFGDNEAITRDFAVYLMLRQIGIKFTDSDFTKIPNRFPDINRRTVLAPYIAFAGHVGISNGYGDGTFGPNKKVSRGELTKMAWKTIMENRKEIYLKYQALWTQGEQTPSVTEQPVQQPEPVKPVTKPVEDIQTTQGISPSLQRTLKQSQVLNTEGEVIGYNSPQFRNSKDYADYLGKVYVTADKSRVDLWGIRVVDGNTYWNYYSKIYRQVKGVGNFSEHHPSAVIYAWLSGMAPGESNSKMYKGGEPYRGEIPAWAIPEVSYRGAYHTEHKLSEVMWGDPRYTLTNEDAPTLARVWSYYRYMKPFKKTDSFGNDHYRSMDTLTTPATFAWEFAHLNNHLLTRIIWSEEFKHSGVEDGQNGYIEPSEVYKVWNDNQTAITREIYNGLVNKLGFDKTKWKIVNNEIVYVPSKLTWNTGFAWGNIGDYAIKLETGIGMYNSYSNGDKEIGSVAPVEGWSSGILTLRQRLPIDFLLAGIDTRR